MNYAVGRLEKIARRLPVALQTCPFECLLMLLCILVGVPVVLGAIEPGSLLSYLPRLGLRAWGVGLLMGGLTLAAGLPRHTYPAILAAGLSLTGTLLGAYSVAVISYSGWATGGVSGAFFAAVALLCGFRSFYLRAESAALERIHESGAL